MIQGPVAATATMYTHQPAFSLAVIQLQAEQAIQAEAGAMVSMSANIELQSQNEGRTVWAIKRCRWRVGLCFHFTARGGPVKVTFAGARRYRRD